MKSNVLRLEEVDRAFKIFVEEFDGEWSRLRAQLECIGQTDEGAIVATSKVHVIVKDEVVIGRDAFGDSKNLWKVTATVTRASEVVDYVFQGCKNLT